MMLLLMLLLLLLQAGRVVGGDSGDGALPLCEQGEDGVQGQCRSSDAATRTGGGGGSNDGAGQLAQAEAAAAAPTEVGALRAATDLAIPNITNGEFVVDHAELFTEEERSLLNGLLLDAKKNSSVVPLVVTVAFIPQPVAGQHLHRPQLIRHFGTAVARHVFSSSATWQLKTLIVILQKRVAAPAGTDPQLSPRIDVFTGKKTKQKLKDGRVRQILRHPNITAAMEHTDEVTGEPEPRYFEATRLVVDRTTKAAKQSGGLFGGGSGGFTGLLPILVGGFAFFYFQKAKFGNSRSSDFDDAQMDHEFQKMMVSNPQLASMMGEMGPRPRGGSMGGMGGMGGSRGLSAMGGRSSMGGGRGMGMGYAPRRGSSGFGSSMQGTDGLDAYSGDDY